MHAEGWEVYVHVGGACGPHFEIVRVEKEKKGREEGATDEDGGTRHVKRRDDTRGNDVTTHVKRRVGVAYQSMLRGAQQERSNAAAGFGRLVETAALTVMVRPFLEKPMTTVTT